MPADDISLEPLFNQSAEGAGTSKKLAFVIVNSVGIATHRTPITVTTNEQEITITAGKKTIEIFNAGSNTVYYGGTGVTSVNGIPIRPNQLRIFANVKDTFSIFVLTASSTSTLNIIEYD